MDNYYTEALSESDARRLLNSDYMSGYDYFLTMDLQHVIITGKDRETGDEFEFELSPEDTQIRDDIISLTDVERKTFSRAPLITILCVLGVLFLSAVIFSLVVMNH